jgi:hypothetical protein
MSKNSVSCSRFTSGYPQKKIFANSRCGEIYDRLGSLIIDFNDQNHEILEPCTFIKRKKRT